MLRLLPSKTSSRALSACLSGLLLALCFPNASILPLLPVALIPLMAGVDGAEPRLALGLGGLFGLVFWIATIPWIAYTVRVYGGVSWTLAVVALVLAGALSAIPFALMAAAVGLVAPRSGAALVLTWGAAWVLQEGFRTDWFPFGGFPWALLGNPLADVPALVQSAAFGGIALTSLLVATLNAALMAALTREGRNGRLLWLAGSCAAVLAVAVAGARHMSVAPNSGRPRLRVGIVQPNVKQESRWDEGGSPRLFRDLVAQTRRLVAVDRPDVVLWPESASPYDWPWDPAYRENVTALAGELDVAILLNTVWSDEPERRGAPYYNAALVVTKEGPLLPPYLKQRLVPFGEYVPLGPLLRFIGPISRAVPGSFAPGRSAAPIPFQGHRLGGAVCYEVVYPWILRAHARNGADVLFTLTNDSWYGAAGARRQHWQSAVVRAVETGKPLIRAAITGISGAVDGSGRVLAEIGPDRKGALGLLLPAPLANPPAVAVGDGVRWVCAAGLLAAILRARVLRPRKPAAAARA
ncbi:MAG TPA: apolipoprotein N-acyltransferase [Thermoanaerobaculia bacterium]|nr:apolipoprotein N-acyltransferase [Thermoanaerobaculia bacterium]